MRAAARHVADRRPAGRAVPGDVGVVREERRTRRALLWVAWVVAGVVAAAGGLAAVAVLRLQSNIHAVDVTPDLGTDRPTRVAPNARGARPLNVLVVGSDSRDGANGFVGGKKDEGRSDTTLVLHLSADRHQAVGVSIPRDSVVAMPSCADRNGRQHPGGERQFNDAYTIGGVGCTQRTVEQLTGLRIDHYVVVDFAGFRDMVDALGTVPICLPRAVDDVRHHIRLPAGRSRVDGATALQYVRERYALGDGGDLGRIDRQQAFVASVLQEATSAGTLTDPSRLYAFLDAATRAVTMDPDLAGLNSLVSLAHDVASVGLGNVQFVTVPNEPYAPDPNRLQWAPSAARLWRALRQDAPLSFDASPTATPEPTGAAPTSPDGAASRGVRLQVLNASGVRGAAAAAAADLRAAGWDVAGTGDAAATGATRTRIRYGGGSLAERRATALAAVLPGAELVRAPGLAASTLQVEVGSDWSGVATEPVAGTAAGSGTTAAATPSEAPVVVDGLRGRAADGDICAP